jgi:DNA-binding NtrC family response regulator
LLRFLETGEVERVGGTEPIRVDVRLVLSVTPRVDPSWDTDMLSDLVSRLAVFPIRLPPLRERRGDVRLLAGHFLGKYARRNARAATSLSNDALSKLETYGWPGNVRELENVVERAAILSRGDVIQPEHLAFATRAATRPPASTPRPAPSSPAASARGEAARSVETFSTPDPVRAGKVDLGSQLEDIERRELLAALERCGGNKAEVARSLGMQRTTLYYRLKRLGIDV